MDDLFSPLPQESLVLAPDPPPIPSAAAQVLIDQALQLIATDACRLEDQLRPTNRPDPSLEHLRVGPLGQDLRRLALVAEGHGHESPEQVRIAIEAVLEVLFWPAGAEDYTVPRSFWETDLGRLLARAKYQTFAVTDLIGIGVAADQLGVTRPTIYRWMDDHSIDYVHDAASRRTYVVRVGMSELLDGAADLSH
jgi:hypothetical protein